MPYKEEAIWQHEPNRVVERDAGGEREWAPLCSVELGETAKGELNIKSVKVYASSVEDASAAALERVRAPAELRHAGLGVRS